MFLVDSLWSVGVKPPANKSTSGARAGLFINVSTRWSWENKNEEASLHVSCVLRVSTLHFFTLDQKAEEKLVPHSRLLLPHCPLDVTFDPKGRLWALMDSRDSPLQIYSHRGDSWEVERTRLHTDTDTRRYDSQMYYLHFYIQKDRKWNMRVKFSPSWIRTRRIWALHVSVIIFSHVFTRNVFNFLFKINQMRVDELLHL